MGEKKDKPAAKPKAEPKPRYRFQGSVQGTDVGGLQRTERKALKAATEDAIKRGLIKVAKVEIQRTVTETIVKKA